MIKKYLSPIGELVLVVENGSLIEVGLDRSEMRDDEGGGSDEDERILKEVCEWLDGYFGGKKMEIGELRLAPEGTEFQKEVWKILRGINYGETMSYGEIAQRMAAR